MADIAQLDRLPADAPKGMPLPELNEQIAKRSERMEHLFAKGGENYDLSDAEAAEVRALNDELASLEQAREQKADYQRMREGAQRHMRDQQTVDHRQPFADGGAKDRSDRGAREPEVKTLGARFVESEEFKRSLGQSRRSVVSEFSDIDLKTVMSTSAGFAPQSIRTGRVVEFATRRPVVADLIPQDPTDQAAVVYMEETTFTNAAAPVAEGAAKPEAALAFTQRSQTVEVIAVNIPITRQQMDDVPQVQATVDNRLLLMLQLAEENQILNGTGTAPALQGITTKTGIQTQAKGTDPTPDAIYRAFTKVRATAFAEPGAVVMHPNDWQDVRLLRTTDGLYIWGSPVEEGPERIWGKPVVVTTAATEGTAITGDFQLFSHISRRMGARVELSTEHSDFFAKNQVLVQAEERLSFEIYRAAAFCTITGL